MKLLTVVLLCVAIDASSQTHLVKHTETDDSTPQQSDTSSTAHGWPDKRAFEADERVAASMPGHSVELAQPVQISVTVTGGDAVLVSMFQTSNEHGAFENQSAGEAVGEGKVIRDNGSTKTMEIIPLQVGRINIGVLVMFADGGIGRKSYQLDVIPSPKGLKTFYINHGGHALAIVLEDKEKDRQTWLFPEVYYKQLTYPIHLSNSEQIKFTVTQPVNNPVIRVDGNGMVHGLRPGRAKMVADFAGVTDFVFVDVYTKQSAPSGYRRVIER